VDISTVWESIIDVKTSAIENLGYYDLKRHKSCFDEECTKLLDGSKQNK